jgi:hypothetical protein
MKLVDVIEYAEGVFDCVSGFPGRFADGSGGSKQYVTLQFTYGMQIGEYPVYEDTNALTEHILSCMMIAVFESYKSRIGYQSKNAKLYWRNEDKVSIEKYPDGVVSRIRTRIYIEGIYDYGDAKVALENHLQLASSKDPQLLDPPKGQLLPVL